MMGNQVRQEDYRSLGAILYRQVRCQRRKQDERGEQRHYKIVCKTRRYQLQMLSFIPSKDVYKQCCKSLH